MYYIWDGEDLTRHETIEDLKEYLEDLIDCGTDTAKIRVIKGEEIQFKTSLTLRRIK